MVVVGGGGWGCAGVTVMETKSAHTYAWTIHYRARHAQSMTQYGHKVVQKPVRLLLFNIWCIPASQQDIM